MEKPALGMPIIIVTIFLFMTGYVYFVASTTTKPEAPSAPPITNIQTPAASVPGQEPVTGEATGLSQPAMPADKEVKSWTGRFAGCVDNNLMVIYVGDEAKMFLSPPELAGAGLVKGDNVSFAFYYDKNGQPVLSTIRKLVSSE
ncbi:MAG: hypothetical protein PHT62_02955 [Desulfotomaculaceae bacterium]|nr:hypothetical protein [Desulfotomaculaceae bacterium]